MRNYFVYARYVGASDSHYLNNQNYVLSVKRSWLGKRVRIANVHGYDSNEYITSIRRYRSFAEFDINWNVIEQHDSI